MTMDKIAGIYRRAIFLAAAAALLTVLGGMSAGAGHGKGGPMPEFTTTSKNLWINSEPLKKAQLKGKVVLLEVWTSI